MTSSMRKNMLKLCRSVEMLEVRIWREHGWWIECEPLEGKRWVATRATSCRARSFRLMSCPGFVVDPDGLGYADIGEEEDWGRAEDAGGDETAAPSGRGAKATDCLPSKRKADGRGTDSDRVAAPPMRMQRMLQAAAARSRAAVPARSGQSSQRASAAASSDALLDDILGGLAAAPPANRWA